MNSQRECVDHSGLMFAALATFCHLLTSPATCAASSEELLRNTSAPNSVTFAAIVGSANTALISALSLLMIAAGVPLGAAMPFQPVTSNPGRNSLMLGTSGKCAERFNDPTAIARSLPERICGSELVTVSIALCTCPAMRSTTIGALPRYGTCTMLTPVCILKYSPATCDVVPTPYDPIAILPGFAFAYAIISGTVLTGTSGLTTKTRGDVIVPATMARSVTMLKLSLSFTA